MPRLRSKSTGVVVNVSDETAGLLSHRFEPVEEPKKAPAKRSSSKSDE